MTEQDLTKKILLHAKQEASHLLADAEQRASEQINTARTQAATRREAALKKGQAGLAYRRTQQQRAHEVATIKAQINAKQTWLDHAFAAAREKLIHASSQEIKNIVDAYTQKYAQPGDKILIAENWAHALPALPTTDTISGGIIIENTKYRIELDLDSILNELREPLAPTIAEILGVM